MSGFICTITYVWPTLCSAMIVLEADAETHLTQAEMM